MVKYIVSILFTIEFLRHWNSYLLIDDLILKHSKLCIINTETSMAGKRKKYKKLIRSHSLKSCNNFTKTVTNIVHFEQHCSKRFWRSMSSLGVLPRKKQDNIFCTRRIEFSPYDAIYIDKKLVMEKCRIVSATWTAEWIATSCDNMVRCEIHLKNIESHSPTVENWVI